MTIMCEIADRIRREGREEGRSLDRLEIKIADILELLGKWHKCAARASRIAEFETKM